MKLIEGGRLQALHLPPDPDAVLLRPFGPAVFRSPSAAKENGKLRAVAGRLCGLDMDACEAMWADVTTSFEDRHPDWHGAVAERWDRVRHGLLDADAIDPVRQKLIGAFFLSEYTFKSTAYFNPSLVPHTDQSGAVDGALRVVMAVRATGEGHISSVAFREGQIAKDGTLTIEDTPGVYQAGVLQGFSLREGTMEEAKTAHIGFEHDLAIGSRILFPMTRATSNGIEDVRLVCLEEGGERRVYGTYTAYDGRRIESQIFVTSDFERFDLMELEGDAVGNKGMALFPRRVNGHYAMLGRQDAERVWLLYSDDLGHWSGGEVILESAYPHEFMHMGNCGSPMETDEGWLVLTHGVGPVREYTLGAALLDLDDPSKVIARLPVPLAATDDSDRHGYVPNAIYSCGGLVHAGRLIVPFGLADWEVRCMDVGVADLIAQMDRC